MGFDLLPKTWKEVFSPSSYKSWYSMIWGVPLLLALLFFWYFIIAPYRKIFK